MCGIAGLIYPGFDQIPANIDDILSGMTRSLRHRGPDHQDIWKDDQAPVALGHRRLSIIDLSYHGHQPMVSASGRYILSYNGEIYNYQELRSELSSLRIRLDGRSDTEALLEAIDKWGPSNVLQKINGMFAFALWDRKHKKMFLARDRMGKKPLYFGWINGQYLAFASELKAFRALNDFTPSLNHDVLAQYMRFGYVPAPYSIYEGIYSLPAGCWVTLDIENLDKDLALDYAIQSYWHHGQIVDMARQNSQPTSEQEALYDIHSLLTDAVQKRLVSDVPVGSFLSGGLDSSLVTAIMAEISDTKVDTFSIGFEEQDYDESRYAKAIADHLGTTHHEDVISAKQALEIIPKLPDIYDEPFADSSQIPTALICGYAKNHISVALTGDGGDEIFGGYQRYISGPSLWRKLKLFPKPVRRAIGHIIQNAPSSFLGKINPGYPEWEDRLAKLSKAMSADDFEAFYMSLISQWPEQDQVVRNAGGMTIPVNDERLQAMDLSPLQTMMFKDSIHYLPNDILTKLDRASMAVSLECRSPLLDYRLFEYMWGMPDSLKVRNGQGKFLLRKLLEHYYPTDLFDRPKQGFSLPVRTWLRAELKDWAQSLIDEIDDTLLDKNLVQNSWDSFLKGNDSHFGQIWTILMFQGWYQRWFRPI